MVNVGVDLGGTFTKIGIVDENANIIHKEVIETKRERDFAEIIKDICFSILNILSKTKINIEKIGCIGLGSSGVCDNLRGIINYSCNIKFENSPVREKIKKYIDKSVFIENDSNCAALGEFICGKAKNSKSSMTITLGTGVGAGLILDGKIYSGINGAALEIGHMVIDSNGPTCTCGRNGCFEVYSSATGLVRIANEVLASNEESLIWQTKERNLKSIDAKTVFSAFRLGDNLAKKIINIYIKYLGIGITNIINIFELEKIILSGGLSFEEDCFLEELKKYVNLNKYTKNCNTTQTEILVSLMKEDAAIIGAAFLGKIQTINY